VKAESDDACAERSIRQVAGRMAGGTIQRNFTETASSCRMFLKSSLQARPEMRTKYKHLGENAMPLREILRSIMTRQQRDLVQDALGASALFAMLTVGLYLPVLV
jgi:hypothetical protein